MPIGPDNPYGNAFAQTVTRLAARRRPRGGATRRGHAPGGWSAPSGSTGTAGPTGYTLYPEAHAGAAGRPGVAGAARAGFAANHLWVTRYDPAQRYPAGDFVNQHPGGAGLPAYVAADRDIDGADIVLWHTFGPTHFPRPEDWPVMPVARCGFTLKPTGFFDRNPALDVPPPDGHCAGPGG